MTRDESTDGADDQQVKNIPCSYSRRGIVISPLSSLFPPLASSLASLPALLPQQASWKAMNIFGARPRGLSKGV
eukprot:750180-Hanusia_phi.AAC.10